MKQFYSVLLLLTIAGKWHAQLLIARDTITVIENGYVQKMPWANGLNFSNASSVDLNLDGRKDLVLFDRVNLFGIGRFRCFIQTSVAATYSANPDLSYSFPQVANWAVFKDYNCDGKEDIFCSTFAGIMVYRNTSTVGSVQFTLAKPLLYSDYEGVVNNLYAAPNGVPGISDIDGDGDIDILTFSPGGVIIEYHKNLSKETYGICDSLNKFGLETNCWGNIIENNCAVSLNQTCTTKPYGQRIHYEGRSLHAGSCLTCLDTDGDNDQDLLMGDITCDIIQYGHNTGSTSTANITGTANVYPNYPAVGNTTQIKMNNFPCGYVVDVDDDGKKDLIATPNVNGSENYQCVWYYRNTSATSTVNFQFVKKNFLQEEMIEVGQDAFPVLFDYDADGDKDLLVGTYGYYDASIVSLRSKLTLYKNTGTTAEPSFSLVTRDYAGLSSYSINAIMPSVGDLDGDGDLDMIIGNQTGQVYRLTNTAGPAAPCNFTFNPTALFTTPVAIASPQLFDINNDGLLDIMVGMQNGRIAYYKNVGTVGSPSFSLITAAFGGVNVQGDQNLYSIMGYAAPFFYNEGGGTKLLVGSVSGDIFYYAVPSATSNCIMITWAANGINEGGQSAPFFEDINGDNKRDLFLGNASGGISFFSSLSPDVSVKEIKAGRQNMVNVYPNPASDNIIISLGNTDMKDADVTIYDIAGKEMITNQLYSNTESVSVKELARGIYFAKITVNTASGNYTHTCKLIKE